MKDYKLRPKLVKAWAVVQGKEITQFQYESPHFSKTSVIMSVFETEERARDFITSWASYSEFSKYPFTIIPIEINEKK